MKAWQIYLAWRNGISPNEYRKSQIRDLKEIFMIEEALNEKNIRTQQLNKLIRSVR